MTNNEIDKKESEKLARVANDLISVIVKNELTVLETRQVLRVLVNSFENTVKEHSKGAPLLN